MNSESLRQWIRQRLLATTNPSPVPGDFAVSGLARDDSKSLKPAAVLVPLVDRPTGFTVLLTQRTEHLDNHAGQISFPGGRMEDHDPTPIDTALRETEEEIGLHRRHVEVIGRMDDYQTITGFLVTPIIGLVEPNFALTLDTFEVAEVFEVPLDFVLDPAHHQRHRVEYRGQPRAYYVIPYENRHIWGATAAMLVNLADKLAGYPLIS
ncbi:MAG: CoA pyrophosphatase [Gammaproteobacteria bacterium]|nr:CoA pyrophosphatase [Gammaproteobacteria bacterium]MCP5424293.1 CoA pyrophosphatase [Gammaproteobacteria bacterium]MCP5459046.1 CoA pyrophosphatase [Gammaproteobacteria bacterium]